MTCYFRHLCKVFDKAGIEVTKENKKELAQIIRQITCEGDCNVIWGQIKKRLAEDEAGFVNQLKTAYENSHSIG
jgi:hypothetical protein